MTINRPKTKPRLNTSVKFTGAVAPVDFAAGTPVQIQRKTGSGACKNWVTVGVGQRRVLDSQKMKKTGNLLPRRLRR